MDLRTTVVMKTDMRDSTKRMSSLTEDELRRLLQGQKQLILDITARYGGNPIKGEGDAFWLTFPSVTGAALAAMTIQAELLQTQLGKGNDTRMAVRIAITLGDVLHQEKDIFGDAVNLAARIEAITPPDDIYLSAAAWAALNHAEVRTSLVGQFEFKGFDIPLTVYRVEQAYRTKILTEQAIVVTELGQFTAISAADDPPIADIERVLEHFLLLHNRVCQEFGGISRVNMHDSFVLTFPEVSLAVSAARLLCQEWSRFLASYQYPHRVRVGIHQGRLYAFRTYLYGPSIMAVYRLENLVKQLLPNETGILLSQSARDALSGTEWVDQLQPLDPPEPLKERLGTVYALP